MGTMTMDEFLGHTTRSRTKKNYLHWTKQQPYNVTIWLHPKAPLLSRWVHRFPKVESKEDKQTRERHTEIWNPSYCCIEDEETLKNKWRDNEGEREMPFQICPFDLMEEAVRRLVTSGALKWTDPVFRFKSDRGTAWLHAGGMCGFFSRKNMTPAEKDEMKAVTPDRGGPIYQRSKDPTATVAYKQVMFSKPEYVLSVVDNDHPEVGIQIDLETADLGDKLKAVIKKAMLEFGAEEGDPGRNPVPFFLQHNPAEDIPFGEKYDVTRLSRVKMSPMVEKLLREPAPDLTSMLEPPNMRTLRSLFEKYCLIKLPWDDIFGRAFAWEDERKAKRVGQRAEERPTAQDVQARVAPQAATQGFSLKQPESQEDLFECDTQGCEGLMRATDAECPKCHRRYNVQAAPLPLPAQPAPAAASGGWSPNALENPEDEIPFVCDALFARDQGEVWHRA